VLCVLLRAYQIKRLCVFEDTMQFSVSRVSRPVCRREDFLIWRTLAWGEEALSKAAQSALSKHN
jgi:hypothetical protein